MQGQMEVVHAGSDSPFMELFESVRSITHQDQDPFHRNRCFDQII